MNKKLMRLVVSGVLLAMAVVLSMIQPFKLPYGGGITPCSMLPICLLAYLYGIKWGLLCGLADGILQIFLGAVTGQVFAIGNVGIVVAMCLLDFIFAFTVLGLSGCFYGKIKNHAVSFALGTCFTTILRFVMHFLSGWILWGSFASEYFETMNNSFGRGILEHFGGQSLAAVYSFVYNGSYMIPEIIITTFVAALIISIRPVRDQLLWRKK